MKRHEFAPLVVPPDARRFLELPENEPYLPSFYTFYREYCHTNPDQPIVREINGESYDFSHVVSSKMTRTKHSRSALALRATSGEPHERHYRLFVRPFKENVVEEYDIIQTRYHQGERGYAPHSSHSMLYLAVNSENSLRQGVLEINGDHHHQSLWVIGGYENLLEDMPRLEPPVAVRKPLPLPAHIVELPSVEHPKAV